MIRGNGEGARMNILKNAVFGFLGIIAASVALAFAPVPLPKASVISKPASTQLLLVSEW
jgi:hypothetical protein